MNTVDNIHYAINVYLPTRSNCAQTATDYYHQTIKMGKKIVTELVLGTDTSVKLTGKESGNKTRRNYPAVTRMQ